jgi:hypothetical protein
MALRELMTRNRMDDMGILLIHGINPYGFKKNRRVTEKNIDLNRNCSMDRRLYDSVNKGYGRLNAWLNPKQKVNLTRFDHFFFPFNMAFKIARHSMATLRQAILQGQYQYKNGIYFGGKALEPSIKAITPLVKKISQNYEMVLGIDIHTGYGTNGKLYLFPSPMTDERKKAQIESIFPQGPIDWGDEKNFYTVTGDFVTYLGQILPDKDSLTLAFEFGTLDTETAMGSIKALHNVIIENQGAQHNYTSQRDEKMVRKRYLQSYYPDSEAWRSKAIEDARTTLVKALQNFKAVP